MSSIVLDKWQEEIIADESKYILLCKGRQIGGTSVYAEKAARRMVNRKTSILVGSITEEQAKLVIVMVKNILERDHKGMIAKGHQKPTLDRIRLKNGSEIRSRPVGMMGDAFRGFTADVNWFNEASKWPEIAFVAIMPTLLTTGGDMWIDSTPFGKQGFFYNAFTNKSGLWKVYYHSSEEVIYNRPISASWTEAQRAGAIAFLEDQKKQLSALQYGQEYMGLFLEDLMQVFPDSLLQEVMVLAPRGELFKDRQHFLGQDIAGMGADDSTWIIVDGTEREKVEMVEYFVKQKLRTPERVAFTLELDAKYHFKQIGIDDGGLGSGDFDYLLSSPVRRKVISLNNARRDLDRDGERKKKLLKEEMYNNLLAMMENKHILLLRDTRLYNSLRSIQYELTDKGARYFGNDTHITEGLIRAAWLARNKSLNIYLESG